MSRLSSGVQSRLMSRPRRRPGRQQATLPLPCPVLGGGAVKPRIEDFLAHTRVRAAIVQATCRLAGIIRIPRLTVPR